MNSFTEQVLLEIGNRNNTIPEIISKVRNAKKVVVWGTGLAGDMLYHALANQGIAPAFYADNNRDKWGKVFHGGRVLGPSEIPVDATVIIAANYEYGIDRQLSDSGIKDFLYVDPVLFYWYRDGQKERLADIYKKNYEKIDDVKKMLADDESVNVFYKVLIHRAIHKLDLVRCIYDKNQYFGNDLVPSVAGNFVDCGAYNGDTLTCFLKQAGDRAYTYYAMEADRQNYEMLKKIADDMPSKQIIPINMAVWDRPEVLFFDKEPDAGDVAGKVQTCGKIKVKADSLDHILYDKPVDFIKMDIEGAEMRALNGAKNIIVVNKPTLAVSAYHEDSHLWDIPLKIQEICPMYKMYYRHHMWNAADTVCYAL